MATKNSKRATIVAYASSLMYWYWCYLAISGLLLSLIYSRELAQRERDLAMVEQLAQTAQIRALRYQINPHFMFNTLNSIAALICTEENATAERMVENLGEFFRASLAVDPQDDHPLEQEVHLQSLYLAIEQLRYPDRVHYKVKIDPRRQSGAGSEPDPSAAHRECIPPRGGARHPIPLRWRSTRRSTAIPLVLEVGNSAPNRLKGRFPWNRYRIRTMSADRLRGPLR